MTDALRAGTHEGPYRVTALRRYDAGTEYPLQKKTMWIGSSSDCDIAIDSPFVSALHCRLDRKLLGLRVTDQRSKNGTYVEGERERAAFYLRPGKTFIVGALPHRFLALNDDMRACYPELVDILGGPDEHALPGETPSPSDMILAAVSGNHLVITSEPGCLQDRLARIIHSLSHLHAREPVEISGVPLDAAKQHDLVRKRAARSTLVLALGGNDAHLPSQFLRAVFDAKYRVRLVVLAHSVAVADGALGYYTRQMQHVWLRPLAVRTEAIQRLLNKMLAERKSSLRWSHLTSANQGALRAHGWPDNFASLTEVADRLSAIHAHGSIRSAARGLRLPPSTLDYWYLKTMRLSIPLVPPPRS